MRVEVGLHASLRRFIPEGVDGSPFSFEVADGATVADVMRALGIPAERAHMITVDSEQVSAAYALVEGQEIRLFPPLAGGC